MKKKIRINRMLGLERCREINRKLRSGELWTAKII